MKMVRITLTGEELGRLKEVLVDRRQILQETLSDVVGENDVEAIHGVSGEILDIRDILNAIDKAEEVSHGVLVAERCRGCAHHRSDGTCGQWEEGMDSVEESCPIGR